jgi:signal peptidase I
MKATPRPWIAVLLALLCNGLGHLYAGHLPAAIAVHLLWLASALVFTATLRVGPGAAAAAVGAAAAFFLGQAVHASTVARRAAGGPRPRSSRFVALAAFYAATVAVSYLVVPSARAAVAHTVYVPAGSMIPTVQVGDVLAVAAGRPSTLRGAVVEVAPPAGSRSPEPLLKRVVAVGGDTVELRDGALWVNDAAVPRAAAPGECTYLAQTSSAGWREASCLDFVETLEGRAYHTHCTPGLACGDVARQAVPAGQVWLAGDHRDHSADSRVFGPVSEGSILGEARWVVLSWGPAGLRRDRMGLPIR